MVELATGLPEGSDVRIIIEQNSLPRFADRKELVDWLRSQPPSPRTEAEWVAYEKEISRARDEWD